MPRFMDFLRLFKEKEKKGRQGGDFLKNPSPFLGSYTPKINTVWNSMIGHPKGISD